MTVSKKRRVSAKTTKTARKTSSAKAFAHWPEGLSPYHAFSHQSREGRLITLAAFVVAGMAKLGKSGLVKSAGNGNAKLLKLLVGNTPYSYHKRSGRITANDTITATGLEWFNARIKSDDDLTMVKATATAFQKGGKVEGLPGVEFKRQVSA